MATTIPVRSVCTQQMHIFRVLLFAHFSIAFGCVYAQCPWIIYVWSEHTHAHYHHITFCDVRIHCLLARSSVCESGFMYFGQFTKNRNKREMNIYINNQQIAYA